MSISPVNFNGMMQRSQDVSTVKQNEDNRPVVEQQQIGRVEEKKIEEKMHKVNDSDKKDETSTKHDAREEGRNKYMASGNKKNKANEPKDKVTKKNAPSSGFDIRI
ncbi:MAG: hypothetical protein IJM91_04775 [Lachnospiraceae bacterium]|nr:hypothetical protein [Lachnospiraceae bacterium]